MRVSLAPVHAPTPLDAQGRSESVARALLAPGGPRVILGGEGPAWHSPPLLAAGERARRWRPAEASVQS